MKARTHLERLLGEIRARGALVDDVAAAVERYPVEVDYPRLFYELVSKHSFVSFVVSGIRVYSNLRGEEDSLEELLSDKILTGALCGAGLSPFGRPATGSYDRVCFDMRTRKHPLDAPVVVVDHEAILSRNLIPRPRKLAGGIMHLFELENVKV